MAPLNEEKSEIPQELRPINNVLNDPLLAHEEASVTSQNIIEKRFVYKVYSLK